MRELEKYTEAKSNEPAEMHWRKFIIWVSAQVCIWMLLGSFLNLIYKGDIGWTQYVGFFSSIVLIAACASGKVE